jgi:hypothetical protein
MPNTSLGQDSYGNGSMAQIAPIIGNWYRHENGNLFEVVALDEKDATIEIQYYDGTIEELDLDTWEQLEIEESEAPDDCSGSLDADDEDRGEISDSPNEDFADPLDFLDRQD